MIRFISLYDTARDEKTGEYLDMGDVVGLLNEKFDEIDRLNARIKELEAAQRPESDDQWDECLDDAISPTMTVIDDGA